MSPLTNIEIDFQSLEVSKVNETNMMIQKSTVSTNIITIIKYI